MRERLVRAFSGTASTGTPPHVLDLAEYAVWLGHGDYAKSTVQKPAERLHSMLAQSTPFFCVAIGRGAPTLRGIDTSLPVPSPQGPRMGAAGSTKIDFAYSD